MRPCLTRPPAVLLALALAAGGARAGAPGPGVQAITGTLQRVQLEGGFWGLRTAAGARYVLLGAEDELRRFDAGQRVTVQGRPRPSRGSIYMWGTLLEVQSVRGAP